VSAGGEQLKNPAARLPDLALPAAGGGVSPVLPPRTPGSLLVLAHGSRCPECRAYLQHLQDSWDDLSEWGVAVTVILPEPQSAEGTQQAGGGFRVLFDHGRRLQQALRMDAGVVIADEWGEIHFAAAAGEQHAFLQVAEVASWGRYLATRCPECEGEAL
jgi:hypothetical protein